MATPQTPPAPGQWTVEDVWRLPEDGNRHEVIDGVLYVTPSPRLVQLGDGTRTSRPSPTLALFFP